MTQHREHFYMATATLHYVRDAAVPRQRTMNLVMQLPHKQITASILNSTRAALFTRLSTENQVPPENYRDIVFDAFSYMGFMTSKDFHDIKEELPSAEAPSIKLTN